MNNKHISGIWTLSGGFACRYLLPLPPFSRYQFSSTIDVIAARCSTFCHDFRVALRAVSGYPTPSHYIGTLLERTFGHKATAFVRDGKKKKKKKKKKKGGSCRRTLWRSVYSPPLFTISNMANTTGPAKTF